MEAGPVDRIFIWSRAPYTDALLATAPVPDPKDSRNKVTLTGYVPNLANLPSDYISRAGCRYELRAYPKVKSPAGSVGEGQFRTSIRDDIL